MVRKQTSVPEAPPEVLVSREEAAAKITERIDLGLKIMATPIGSATDSEAMQSAYYKWDEYNQELLTRFFSTPALAREYLGFFHVEIDDSFIANAQNIADAIRFRNDRLDSIRNRLELIPVAAGVKALAPKPASRPSSKKVFVVHGQDEGAKQTAARFLEKLGLEAIILHEQVTKSMTIIEKLEHYSDVNFAVVLLTADDVGTIRTDAGNLQPRARQNVILELGFFVGKLGRQHVCALQCDPIELPSDFLGVGYIPMDSHGAWRYTLAKELKAVGFSIDMNEI